MARGRKPQPAAVKLARGNPGKRRIADAPKPGAAPAKPAKFRPPGRLSARAKKIWHTLAAELVRLNFLRATDLYAFERYCYNLDRFWTIATKLKSPKSEREVYWTDSQHGKMMRVNPWFAVQDRIERRLESFEDSFGLSPAARQRIMQQMAATPALLPLEPHATGGESDAGNQPAEPPSPSPIGLLSGSRSVH